jgi:hypothetical protein
MQRLRDLRDCDDPALAELARLVRATDVEPRPGAYERVRNAIAEPRRHRRWWHQPVVVVVVLAILFPMAIAGVSKLLARTPEPTTETPRAPDSGTTSAPTRHEPPAPPVTSVPADPPPLPKPAEPQRPMRRPLDDAPRTQPRIHTREPSTPVETAQSVEAMLVLGALRSLRHDHDLPSAIRQLDEYLARFPTGDLVEEALALTIEALAAQDNRDALRLADEYLRRFPRGRFRDQAEGARRRFVDRR